MELIRKSAINESWRLCTIAAFLGLFLLTLLITNNTPQSFQISTSKTTVDAAGAPQDEIPVSQGNNFTDTSDAVLLQAFIFPEKVYIPSTSLSPPEVDSAIAGAVGQATFTKISDEALLQPFNSSSIEENLFSSLPEVAPAGTANATAAGGEYEIPSGDAKYHNSTSMLEGEEIRMSPEFTSAAREASVGEKKCRMYEGRWVYKPEENPRYHVSQCKFLEEKMSCRRNGRPDFEYEGWSWESNGCHVPLFNGTDMLERLRGKRMIMAGDSLNRNQWESLACLLYTSIPPSRAYVCVSNPAYKVFKAKDYEFKMQFYWAPFLVHLDENHKSGKKVLSLDKLVPSSKRWRGADVMVFNSGHWWTHQGGFRAWDVFEYGGEHVEEVEAETAYERALTVWARWVAHNVDQSKTKVYFRSISPEHKNKQWCFNHSRPMEGAEPYDQQFPRTLIHAVERKIREMNGHDGVGGVRYLNITGLSSHRIDAHPSIYWYRHWKVIVEKYKRLLQARSDCSHWCLPGVPDTWNRILYASLFFDHLVAGDLYTS